MIAAQQLEVENYSSKARVTLNNCYLIWRHGESKANVAGIIVSKPENGIASWGLTEVGFEQVRRSATIVSRLSRLLGPDSIIYSSPFLRCVQTAEEIAQVIDTQMVLLTDDLKERNFGEFEGQHAAYYNRVYQLDRVHPGHNFFGVESTEEVAARVTGLVNRLEALHQGRVVVLVTHADVGEILQASLYGMLSWEHRRLPKLKFTSPVDLRYRYIRERLNAVC